MGNAGGDRIKPDSGQKLPDKNGPCPETRHSASSTRRLKPIDRHRPCSCVKQTKAHLQQVELQAEPKRPRPAPAEVPHADAKQAGASHSDEAAKKDQGKALARERRSEQEPERKERQPCSQDDGTAPDCFADHFVLSLSQFFPCQLTIRRENLPVHRYRLARSQSAV